MYNQLQKSSYIFSKQITVTIIPFYTKHHRYVYGVILFFCFERAKSLFKMLKKIIFGRKKIFPSKNNILRRHKFSLFSLKSRFFKIGQFVCKITRVRIIIDRMYLYVYIYMNFLDLIFSFFFFFFFLPVSLQPLTKSSGWVSRIEALKLETLSLFFYNNDESTVNQVNGLHKDRESSKQNESTMARRFWRRVKKHDALSLNVCVSFVRFSMIFALDILFCVGW